MTKRLLTLGALAIAIVLISWSSVRGASQAQQKGPKGDVNPKADANKTAASNKFVPPRTPWGDPNLQGNFTNKYEQSTPFERPREFD